MPSLRHVDNEQKWGLFSSYCGLGGAGIPQHAVDQLCKIHDAEYENLMQKGINPYRQFNKADREFLRGLKRIVPKSTSESVLKKAAQFFFRIKEQLSTKKDEEFETPPIKKGRVRSPERRRGRPSRAWRLWR